MFLRGPSGRAPRGTRLRVPRAEPRDALLNVSIRRSPQQFLADHLVEPTPLDVEQSVRIESLPLDEAHHDVLELPATYASGAARTIA